MKKTRGYVGRRGQSTKKEYPVFLYVAEGDNKTESIYFNNFKRKVRTKIRRAAGNYTDPVKMMKQLMKQAKDLRLSVEKGDHAFCFIDTDTALEKQEQIDMAFQKQNALCKMIVSSPCFEEWFLLHYRNSTKQQASADAVNELKKYCNCYHKSYNIYPIIQSKTDTAIQRAKALEKYHEKQGRREHNIERNPSTTVYKVVEYLLDNLK